MKQFNRLLSFSLIILLFSCTNSPTKKETATIDGNYSYKTISVDSAYQLVNSDGALTILDVRTKSEYSSNHLKSAININFYDDSFKSTLNRLEKTNPILVYCRSGNRSGQAMEIMKNLAFNDVYNMQGGIIEWINKKYPVEK